MRRNHSAMVAQGGSTYSPMLSPRTSTGGSGGMQRGRSGPVGGACGSSAVTGRASLDQYDASAAEEAALQGVALRSPRQAVSEEQRQQIFDRLYNSAKEQRVRRHTHAELARLHEEVRLSQDCPFEPRTSQNKGRTAR